MAESGPEGERAAAAREGFRERYSVLLSLLIPALLLGLGRGFTAPVLPILARDTFQVSASAAILTVIAPMVGSVIATMPTGYLLDRIGRRRVLIAGPFFTAVSSFLAFFAGSYAELLTYLVINGIALQMWQMGRLAAIADTGKSSERGRMITGMAGLQRVGSLSGPFVGGIVGEFVGLRVPFIMYGLLALAATVPMIMYMQESAPAVLARRRGEKYTSDVDTSWKKLLTFPVVILFIAQFSANLARGGANTGSNPYLVFAAYVYGTTTFELGALSLIIGIIGVPMTFLAGMIMDRFGRKRTVVPASASLGVALGSMALVALFELPIAVFVASFVWVNLSISMMSGSMQTIGSDVAPPGARGKFFGVVRLIAEAGSVSNPAIFAIALALIAGLGGYTFAFAVTGASGLFTSVLIGRLLKETLVREPREKAGAVAETKGA